MNGKLSIEQIGKLRKLKTLFESPLYGERVSPKAKKFMALLGLAYPEIGLEPEKRLTEIMTEPLEWEKEYGRAIKKGYQAELAGITEPESTLETLAKKGFVPELKGKTFWGKVGTTAAFPLLKLMSGLMAVPRAYSAQAVERMKSMAEKFPPGEAQRRYVKEQRKLGQPIEFKKYWELRKPYPIGEVLKESVKGQFGKKQFEVFATAFLNKPGEYQDYHWAKALKEIFPELGIAKPFTFAKEWGAEEAPWYKKVVSGLAGSPADIIGLAMDILGDPITFITLGYGFYGKAAAKTGIAASKNILVKGGKVLLPKGTPVVLTKLGSKVIEEGTKKILPRVSSFVSKIISTGKPLTKTAKLFKGMPKEILERGIRIKVTENVLRNTVKNMPYSQAAKLIDFGGIKFMGQTLVPGFKLTKAFKPIIAKLEKVPLMAAIEKAIWTRKGFPAEMRPLRTIIKSQMRHRYEEGAKLIQDIFKGLSKSELDDVGKYIWMQSDVALYAARGKKPTKKLISALDTITKKLTPKELKVANRYQKEFVEEFLAKFEKELLIEYPELAKYYPARDLPKFMYEEAGRARHVAGPETAVFQEQKRRFYLQAQKLIKEGKIRPRGVIKASLQRTFESTTSSGRAMMMQEVKRFASPIKKAGFTSIKGIPELKGWKMADEFIEPLLKVEKAFYGDEGFRWTMRLIDKGLDVWRKTALFTPGYHFRNLWTDLISGTMEYGPKFLKTRYWKEALDIQRRRHVPIKSLKGMYADKAYDLFAGTGVKSGGWYAEEAGKGVYRGVWSSRNTPFALSRRAGIFREDLGRIVCGLIEMEMGSSIESVVEQVGKVFYHYWDITQFERQFGRRFLNPFWTWYSKNIRRQVELLFTRPGAYAAIPKVATFVEGMSKMPDGYREYRPEYFADLFAIMTPFRTLSGIPLVLNPNFAWQDWSRLSVKDFFSSLNPMLKIPIELAIAKKEIFFNKPIREGKYVEAPTTLNWCKKLPADLISNFGMKVGSDEKLYMTEPALYIWKQNPLFYNLMRLYPATEKPKTPYDWLSILVGIKFFPYEEEKSKLFYYQRFVDEVNKIIGAKRVTGEEVPTITEIESAYKEIYGEEVGKKYDIEKIQLIKALLSLRGGKKVARAREAIKLIEQPYKAEMEEVRGKSIAELTKILKARGIKPTKEEVVSKTKEETIAEIKAILESLGIRPTKEEMEKISIKSTGELKEMFESLGIEPTNYKSISP